MYEEEFWKDISGYEGVYQVSSQGQVRRIWTPCNAVYPEKTCRRIAPFAVTHGYLAVKLSWGVRKTQALVHRLVATAFVKQARDNQIEVNHKNRDKQDNRACNLEWVTHKENAVHAMQTGSPLRGERVGTSVLTKRQVIQIREMCSTGAHTFKEISDLFGVSPPNIRSIARGKTWRHLGDLDSVVLPPRRNHAKLTPEQVRQIRKVYRRGKTRMADIASQFEISTGQVSNIVNYKNWKDV